MLGFGGFFHGFGLAAGRALDKPLSSQMELLGWS
jgi:hypothetical protein